MRRKLRRRETEAPCSFCGKTHPEARALVAGRAAVICDGCILRTERLLRDPPAWLVPTWRGLPPASIKAMLDERVIGQERAKRVLSVALYNHYKRIAQPTDCDPKIGKSNILLLGPTGSGKTLLAKSLADIAEVPFVSIDATTLTAAGYAGADVESILLKLVAAAEYDTRRAAMGIVYIDEIDKLARKVPGRPGGRDIGGEDVQQGLLRILEGATAPLSWPSRTDDGRDPALELETAGMLVICGGQFAGLEDIVLAREHAASTGFGDDAAEERPRGDVLGRVGPDDLVAFGLIPEFVGRLPVVAPLHDLDEDDLLAILTRPRDALVEQYKLLFRLSGIELEFETAALRTIARRAMERGTGARGLRAILEQLLLWPMFALPDSPEVRRLTIDQESAARGTAWPACGLGEPPYRGMSRAPSASPARAMAAADEA